MNAPVDTEIVRQSAKPVFGPLGDMWVERGTHEDWEALHHLHYKSEGRPVGAQYWRLTLQGEVIGVTAVTLPRPLLKERHKVWPELAPKAGETKSSNTARYQYINGNFRVIGRIVLDTMFRGVGASYRFQNLVSRMHGFRFMEIQSAMSKYNLFAQRAGFDFVKPMRSNKYEQGLNFFLENFSTNPADTDGILRELESMPPSTREATIARTRKFYYANSAIEKTGSARGKGTSKVDRMPVPELIRQLQQLILGSPIYGLYANPDFGRKDMPERLPLLAFDRQSTKEKLVLT